MDKRKGIILAIVLFLLIGLGTFVFAGSNEEILDGNDITLDGNKDNTNNDTALVDKEDSTTTPVRTPSSSSSTGQTTNGALTEAEEAVKKAEDSLSQDDIDTAKDLIEDLTDGNDKTSLTERIDAVQNLLDVTKLVEELKTLVTTSENEEDMNASRDFRTENKIDEAIALLSESENKTSLTETLTELAVLLDDTTAPILNGVPSGATNESVTITVDDTNEVVIILNDEEVTIDDLKNIIVDGEYNLEVKDAAFNTATATFTIDTTPIIIDGIDEETYIYDGEGVTPTTQDTDIDSVILTKNGNEIEYELGTAIVDAGEYVLTITDKAGNPTLLNFVIEKATPEIIWSAVGATIDGTKATATYNGTGKEFTAILKKVDSTESLEVIYTYQSGNKVNGLPTTADKFKVKALYVGDENYNSVEEVINLQIKKGTIKIEFTEEPTDYEYDGTKKEFKAIAKYANGNEENITLAYYEGETKLDGAPTEAGIYTVVAVRKGDHNHNDATKVTKEFEITKATPEIVWSGLGDVVYDSITNSASTTYNGQAQAVKAVVKTVNGEEELEVSYYINGKLLSSAPIGRNPYDVKVSYAGDRNHNAVEETIKFTIKKFNATFKFTEEPTNYVYDGTKKEFKAVAVLATEEKELELTYFEGETKLDGAPVNAGTYTVKATYRGDSNNNGFGTKSKTFTIEKAETEVVITLPENLVYDGNQKLATAKVLVKGTDVLVTELRVVYKNATYGNLDYIPVNAGNYIAAAHYGDKTGNYKNSYLAVPYTIEKAETEVIITLPENLVYNNTQKVVTAKVMVKDTDILVTEIPVVYKDSNYVNLGYIPVNAGEYIAAAHYGDKTGNYVNSYNQTKYTITKATPEVVYNTATTVIYDGTEKPMDFTIYDVDGYEISDPARYNVVYKDATTNTVLDQIPTESGKYIFAIYVRPDNRGNGNYTEKYVQHTFEIVKPVSTAADLTNTVKNAKDGDIITLADGTYNLDYLHIKKNITLRGSSKENTIINVSSMQYNYAGVVVQANATIENLTLTTNNSSVNVLKATFRDTDYSNPNATLDTFVIKNVNVVGGRVGINIHGVNNALVDGVSIQSAMPLSVASGNVRVINSQISAGTWAGLSITLNHKIQSTDYPTTAKLTLGYNNQIAGHLRIQEIEEGNIIEGNLKGWTLSDTKDGEGYSYYLKN